MSNFDHFTGENTITHNLNWPYTDHLAVLDPENQIHYLI